MRVRCIATVVAVAGLWACSDSPVQPKQIKAGSAAFSHLQGSVLAPHEIAPLELYEPTEIGPNGARLSLTTGNSSPRATPATPPNIRYRGGEVINNQKM